MKLVEFLKRNAFVLLYAVISIFIELLGVIVASGKFFMSRPGVFLTLVAAGALVIIYCRSQKLRYIISSLLLVIQSVICLFFITSFILTSGTIFDFAQFHLAQDGMGTIESIKLNLWFFFPAAAVVGLYVVFGAHYYDELPKLNRVKYLRTTVICLLCVTFSLQGGFAYIKNNDYYADMNAVLYNSAETNYSDQGIIGNFVNQLYRGVFFSNVKLGDADELHDFIYEQESKPTAKFGEAKDMNVITILAESFEWFAFISDTEKYPNGIDTDEATMRALYPNLYALYDGSYIFDNHHSREKTDISENYSVLGCYPTGVYVNYNFPNNALPFSVPNVMNALYGVESNSYHNGQPNFYNRTEYLETAVGFNSFTASDRMKELSGESGVFTDYTPLGERNLDSEMIEICKEEMFPADRRFNTNITTITQHGQYTERSNLKEYYDKLDEYGFYTDLDTLPARDKLMQSYMRTYMAAAMELDKAIGVIDGYLKENGLYDNTMLVIFGDHNAYYENMSAYVKGLENVKSDRNYCDLFRVPLMIRVGNKTAALSKEERTVKKFTCSADIVPTVYDLLGIKYFANMCYGTSAFDTEKVSVLYSRAYEVFITDKMYFYNLNNIIYQAPDADKNYVAQIKKDASELLFKLSHVNRIFYNDYFKGNNSREFARRLNALNPDALKQTT